MKDIQNIGDSLKYRNLFTKKFSKTRKKFNSNIKTKLTGTEKASFKCAKIPFKE